MPEPAEQVYRDAAEAMVGTQGYNVRASTRKELAAGWWRRQDFRAAVQAAYQAGYLAAAQRVITAAEQPDGEAADAYWSATNITEAAKVKTDG